MEGGSVSALAGLTRDKRGFGCGLTSFLLKTKQNKKSMNHKLISYRFSYLVASIAVIIAAVGGRVSRYGVGIIVDDDDGVSADIGGG
jgi:hypothetical protein